MPQNIAPPKKINFHKTPTGGRGHRFMKLFRKIDFFLNDGFPNLPWKLILHTCFASHNPRSFLCRIHVLTPAKAFLANETVNLSLLCISDKWVNLFNTGCALPQDPEHLLQFLARPCIHSHHNSPDDGHLDPFCLVLLWFPLFQTAFYKPQHNPQLKIG